MELTASLVWASITPLNLDYLCALGQGELRSSNDIFPVCDFCTQGGVDKYSRATVGL